MDVSIRGLIYSLIIIVFSNVSFANAVDFTVLIKTDNGNRVAVNQEVLPTKGDLQLQIYSKENGFVYIYYSSSSTERSSLLKEKMPIKVGELLTLPSNNEYFSLDVEEGIVSFEFGFTGQSQTTIKNIDFYAQDLQENPTNINTNIDEFEGSSLNVKSDQKFSNYIKHFNDFNASSINSVKSVNFDVNNNYDDLTLRSLNNIYKDIAMSTVYVENWVGDERLGVGSGILITKDLILTNLHVVDQAEDVTVIPYGGWADERKDDIFYVAEIIKISESKDLALLRLNTEIKENVNTIQFENYSAVEVGSNTHAVGHPDDDEVWSYARGYISNINKNYKWNYDDKKKFEADVIQNSTDIMPGFSGGPLVNDQGKIIGLNTFGNDFGFEYAVAVNELESFITSENNFNGWLNLSSSAPEEKSLNAQEDYTCLDENKNGKDDLCYWDVNKNEKWEMVIKDINHDGEFDQLWIDADEDSAAEELVLLKEGDVSLDYNIHYFNDNGDSEWDRIGYDYDGDLVADKIQTI